MGNVERIQDHEAEPTRTQRARTVPSDWFLDPADPDAAERYGASRALEDAATAFLEANDDEAVRPVTLLPGLDPLTADEAGLLDLAPDPVWLPVPGFPGQEDEGEFGWQAEALCAQTDPEAFFPEKGGSTRDAKKVCSSCTVRAQCLEYALKNDERFGIWGGLSERERRRLRKRAN